jgi:hypothetical protein
MLRGLERRLARVEALRPIPVTAERFLALSRRRVKPGADVGSAMAKVAQELSDAELESLAAELEEMAFGSDTAARDAAKREFFAAAACPLPGCPDLDKNKLPETEEFTW